MVDGKDGFSSFKISTINFWTLVRSLSIASINLFLSTSFIIAESSLSSRLATSSGFGLAGLQNVFFMSHSCFISSSFLKFFSRSGISIYSFNILLSDSENFLTIESILFLGRRLRTIAKLASLSSFESSRTVPYISKVTGIPIVDLATKVILGAKVKDFGYGTGLAKKSKYIAIKMPVFSFEKLRGAEISLGPEMKSTGECLGISKDFNEALYKAFKGAGVDLPKHKKMIITLNDADKEEGIEIAKRFKKLGYDIFSTRGTAKVFNEAGVLAIPVNRINEEAPTLMDLLLEHQIDLVIDTPTHDDKLKDGFIIRRTAIETGVNVLTSLDTAEALVTSLENTDANKLSLIDIATIARR